MCKSLKDLIISQNDSIDIRDCYKQESKILLGN
jgi:hypothetical protein